MLILYEIKNRMNYYSRTNNWVLDNIKLIVIGNLDNYLYIDSINNYSLLFKDYWI